MKKIKKYLVGLMLNYLRKREFVVFHLPTTARECKDMCWLKLYEDRMAKDN